MADTWAKSPADYSSTRANTAPIHILTSEMCSTHQYEAFHFIFVPFHMHTTETKAQVLVVRNYQNWITSGATV